ncbi:L-methionine/branched-chain amino acid transporter [Shewanella avicenniae]|uniref:L-methionine/branched-chain amino acid transporter n=1 Tax=Shewanella avicenniae TaxID=2814294 RepID=A0ABX7QRH9_9GAMM|nr:L-methionine/branched-chain amino acid transporter [Shewanella avicenniae]QSX33874.1 L-methionine/branched-chain amino acid transporter [Shewanella avicenniae]
MTATSGTIGRWQGAGLMATTLLGTGVFILPQMTIDIAGAGALLAWGLLTLAIIPIALVFARLGSKYAHAAGPAYFVEQAFGRLLGRAIGLCFLLIVPIGAPAAILMTMQFINALVPISGWVEVSCELAVLLLLLVVNLRGIQVSAKAQLLLTLAMAAVVIAMCLSGIIHPALDGGLQRADVEIPTMLKAFGIAFWSFLGIEAMTHLSADFRRPAQDLVPAMMTGTVLVGAIYLACSWLLLQTDTDAPVAMMGAFDTLLGGYGAAVIGGLGIASGLATVNVYSASVARLLCSFSEQGILPGWFKQRNQYQVPVRALAIVLLVMAGVIVINYVADVSLEQLLSWANGVFVGIYLLSMLAALKLLDKSARPLALFSSTVCLLLAYSLGSAMIYAIVLLVVLLVLLWWQQRIKQRRAPTQHPC